VRPPRRVIVLGSELPRATAVIRSLGAAGMPVTLVDHRLGMPGAFSRYVRESLLLEHGEPRRRRGASAWHFDEGRALDGLETLGRHGGGLLVPTNDAYLVLVARHHERLSKHFVPTLPPWEVVRKLMVREPSYAVAGAAGLDVPRLVRPRDEQELRRIAAALDLSGQAWLLRLDVWEGGATDPRSGAFTRPAGDDPDTLIERCLEVHGRVGVWPMIQEVVPGGIEACIGISLVMDPRGEPISLHGLKRLALHPYATGGGDRHPYELGANVYAQSARDDEAAEAAVALLRHVGFHGAATVEFRRDARNGRLRFIKVDPRFVNSASLSRSLGLDAPLALLRSALGEAPGAARGAPPLGVGWIWLDRWLRSVVAGRGTSARAHPRRLAEQLRRVRAFAYWSRRDPRPWQRAWQMEWSSARFGLRPAPASRRTGFPAGDPD
jgi:predicted ATP-grasp superfamily ATP-dependent carboligase